MKKLILICLPILFLAGCVGNQMIAEKHSPETGKLEKKITVQGLSGMVNQQVGALKLTITETDGNDIFTASLTIIDHNIAESPESATAILNGITNVISGGAAGAVDNLTK